MLLEKKVSVVTGAAQGIGEGIASMFSREGSTVIICDKNEEGAKRASVRIKKMTGRTVEAMKLDVRNGEKVRAVVESINRAFGRIDILVNCAGILRPVPFLEITEDVWDDHFAVNVRGAFLMSQAVCRIMWRRGGCKIVNISSDSGVVPFADEAAYAASKSALIALTRAIAKDLGKYGIYCNAVCPGAVITPMLRETYLRDPEKENEYIESTALKRMAQPDDIARVALFFASKLSEHVTGEHLLANAGDIMSQ
jgi:NAD(P)-dependent dehydrogenase (short-subunit alcohol dehydrogenase family)